MIEAGMYIALGFFTAILIAMAVLPAFYKRAVRLTREAMIAVNPSSYAEVRAVQDFERANHALALRRVEVARDHERETSVHHRAETGRLQAEVSNLRFALEESLKDLERKKTEIAGARGTGKSLSQRKKTQAVDVRSDNETAETSDDSDNLKERLAETEQALASTRAELDLLKSRIENPGASWRPAADTMALATITGLESQVATLKARAANRQNGQLDIAADPATDVDEMQETRAWASKLEDKLVDAEARFISSQAEVARLAAQMDQAGKPSDGHREALERDLKWADNEAARLTALVRNRERALERTSSKLQRLRDDLRRTPELAELREDLLLLSSGLLSGTDVDISRAARLKAKKVTASRSGAGKSQGEGQVLANASALLGRIVRASLANTNAKPAPAQMPQQEPEPIPAPETASPAADASALVPEVQATVAQELATESPTADDSATAALTPPTRADDETPSADQVPQVKPDAEAQTTPRQKKKSVA
ncbi:hypothetical protein J0X15_16805 [Roseibium sp. CAU 1637]|uniref:Uncharacterized protein n=1 Tax=Roseibium limicola TaxID=2816037 RepID=A0A939ERA7_9HYPH|nr:hypothetical protein [Roseibium limicola]MBO0346890.1 hypothetical protein [Roseibium limicola]